MLKYPPIEKIYEALGAISANRVHLEDSAAKVDSSDFKKIYTIQWQDDAYTSNDSATYWQGYAGYPVIAVLMLQGRLPFSVKTAAWFKDVNWHALNAKYKRNYAAAANAVLEGIAVQGGDTVAIRREIASIYEALKALPITLKRGTTRAPK